MCPRGKPTRFGRVAGLCRQSFAGLEAQALLAQRDRLKHALMLVAIELGFPSWTAAKTTLEAPPVPMHEPQLAALLNRWFADYHEARESLREHGGYLLPFRRQFLVTEGEGIRALGLDPDDPDWQRIGYDWVRPADRAAHARSRAGLR